MNELIEREAAVDIARRTGDTDRPIGPHTCLTPEQESIWRDACGVVERGIRALDPSTRHAKLKRAARQALDLLATGNVRKLLDAMCCCDPDVGHVCFGCATVTELFHALAALDGGEGK